MSHETEILSEILEEFLGRIRNGKAPDVEEYALRHPLMADRIRELFPMAALLEDVGRRGETARPEGLSPFPENPYLSRVMIEDPSIFFGRSKELARVFSRIGAKRPQSVSVVGERRIGKSSLLNAVTWRKHQLIFLPDPDPLIFVFLDFQQLPKVALEEFFELLIDRVVRGAGMPKPRTQESPFRAFQDLLEELQARKKRLILLLDEFDCVTSNPAFDTDFYSFLRSCANNYPVAFVTSSRTDLQRLCHSSTIADSPFFNIFSSLYLRTFDRKDALELIQTPSRRSGVPLEDHTDAILRLSGFFPFYIQIACSVYHEWIADSPGTAPCPEELKERFLEEASPHFSFFWTHCTSEEQDVLRTLAAGRQPPPERAFWARALERTGYIQRKDDKYLPFSACFLEQIAVLDSLSDHSLGTHRHKDGDTLSALSARQTLQQYRILRELGKGGMGVVYLAEDLTLLRRVVLKVCRPELVFSQIARKRTLQEARTAAALKHPGIAGVYELLDYHGLPVIVMEWVDGRTLSEILAERGPIPWRELVPWLAQACGALHYAHSQGLVHRDIKPSNLMLTQEGQVKLTDFGLAKWQTERSLATRLTASGDILGTINYMPPEQAKGEEADGRSDLFSLGVLMFEALTTRLPFQRRDLPSTLQAILNDPIPYLGLYSVENASQLDRIVRKMTQKRPEDRFQNAAQAAEALERLSKKRKNWLSRLRPHRPDSSGD